MLVTLLTEHYLEFLSLTRGCTDSSESIHVKMPHFWKSHIVCLFVLVALRPKSTAMVIAGRSVHLTTLFPGQA